MSRLIKFRAWDSRNREMVYSDSQGGDCFYVNAKGVMFMYGIPNSESGLTTEYYKSYDVMQSTGLTDVNGVEIYEFMEMDNEWEVQFLNGCYVLINISSVDIIPLSTYIRNSNGKASVTKEYTKV